MRRNLFLRYLAETRATVAITFSLASIPLLLAIGGAVDHARAFSQKSALQKAADAAVLAAAGAWRADPELTTTDLNAIAEAIFHPNVENAKFARQGTTNFQLTAVANSITAQVTTTVPTTFLKLAGLHEIRIAVESQAPAPPFDGEIAFVLDHSNSMTGTKHTKMLDATTELLDKLTASGTNNKVKISLVPFAGAVYVSLPGEYALDGVAGNTWTNCTRDRHAPYNVGEEAPIPGNSSSLWGRTDGDDVISESEYDICQRFADSNLEIRRLTSDHADTRNQLSLLDTVGGTGTSIVSGLQFAWQVLSPSGIWQDGASYGTKPKFVFLLSDGRQTQNGFGPGNSYTLNNALNNLQTLCSNMKAKGITIVTIAYEIDDPAGKDELRACASDSQYYAEASGNTLASILKSIGHRVIIGDLRLTM